MTNLVPRRYRGVSLAEVDSLSPEELRRHFVGREAYRRTEYIVARAGAASSVLRVTKASEEPLFSPIVDIQVLARVDETAFVIAPKVDTAVPTQLSRAALDLAPAKRCVVVQGRYEHVNFILDPAPIRLRVVEVAPPDPPKLLDQLHRLLETADDLPPVDLRPEVVDLLALAATHPSPRYLFPCRGSGVAPSGAETLYLDQRPPRADWVLVGCARSREIHQHVYGELPPTVDMCPRELARSSDVPTLTKCCLLEEGIERDGLTVVVPWGASLGEVREGLGSLLEVAEPAWAPA